MKPTNQRAYFNEVAEVFEEVLLALESGQTSGNLKPREKKSDMSNWMNRFYKDSKNPLTEEEKA